MKIPGNVPGDLTMVEELMGVANLSTYEEEFLENTHEILSSGRKLTTKQHEKLLEIYEEKG